MFKIEAQSLMYEELSQVFFYQGFKGKKKKEFIRKNDNGYDGFAFGMIDFYTVHICRYSVFKRLENIEAIMKRIVDIYDIYYFSDKRSLSLAFGPNTLKNTYDDMFMPEMRTKQDVENSAKLVIDFMIHTGFPLLDKFAVIQEIDKEINGKEFWKTDWKKPFNLGGGFEFKRIIIAYLCNNTHFDEITTYQIKKWKDRSIELPKCLELIEAYKYLLKILPNYPTL